MAKAKLQDFKAAAQELGISIPPRGLSALEQSIQADGWIGAITVAADGETFDGSGGSRSARRRAWRMRLW